MSNRTLRGNVEVFLAYPEAFANAATPTAAELNSAVYVHKISCAVDDDFTLNLTSSDTDDSRSICDVAKVSTPTFDKYEGTLPIFRDEDVTATGVFNLAFNLLKAKGIRYWVGVRVGLPQGTAFAAGQIVSLFDFETDYPGDIADATSPMRLEGRLKPQGTALVEYEVAA